MMESARHKETTRRSITLSEWQTKGPEDFAELEQFLDDSKAAKVVTARLENSRLLKITELRKGLEVRSFSHVGRIQIGDLSVTVLPKLRGQSLLKLLRYAYGFRQLKLLSDTSLNFEDYGFEDLLVHQLNAETKELWRRGLQRNYLARNERLASPRGRIDIQKLAADSASLTATLPCRHFPRIEDILVNRLLLAGLELAARVVSNRDLSRESRMLAANIGEQVSDIELNSAVLDQVERQINRMTKNYSPAISIIRLLVEGQGISFEGERVRHRLSGFMFDMNAFFQDLLSRFLDEHLQDFNVINERSLKHMMQYNPNFSPARTAPTPRPDYVITSKGKTYAILDAKYRDIWEKKLPREMLYQLVVYAISNRAKSAAIVYPTTNSVAREVRIDVSDPLSGSPLGQVCLRPMNLEHLESLVTDRSEAGKIASYKYAMKMAFGCQS
jgi:5-methylcytosine-specific restriction enzyme subunit McrC